MSEKERGKASKAANKAPGKAPSKAPGKASGKAARKAHDKSLRPTDVRHVIQRAIFTEKSYVSQEDEQGKPSLYFFQVDKKAHKPDILKAVCTAFGLSKEDILSVRTHIRPGKFKRRGRGKGGYTPERKKAIVTLRAGKAIDSLQRL
ncbi:MAG: 50S ribosomal protein L23 [Deltaproteobacteria bacterium]|jgi:ribosomal protein L23|nr:50S ribosomal protein L23 [Deltaproteobacteria bacterium]